MSLREFQEEKCFFNLTKHLQTLERAQSLGPWFFIHKALHSAPDISLSDYLIIHLTKGFSPQKILPAVK